MQQGSLKFIYYAEPSDKNTFSIKLNYEDRLSQYYIAPGIYRVIATAISQSGDTVAEAFTFTVEKKQNCHLIGQCGDEKV